MPTESKTLTAERIRKEAALASLRELQLAEKRGRLLDAGQVEAAWSEQIGRIRAAVLRIPSRVALQFADPHRAEEIVRQECELVLRTLARNAG
jgi:phage terminase Nu1 subunit (DNA packaging protein)